jgi:hypothetical protein
MPHRTPPSTATESWMTMLRALPLLEQLPQLRESLP